MSETTVGTKVGTVSHWYGNLGVAGVTVEGDIEVGDTLRFVGHTTDFSQAIESMQIDHADVESAKAGDSIGVKVADRVRVHDEVYRVDA